jgi:hypothetical protein
MMVILARARAGRQSAAVAAKMNFVSPFREPPSPNGDTKLIFG